MLKKHEKLDDLLRDYSHQKITIPDQLVDETVSRMMVESGNQSNPLPFLLATVVFINMLTSLFIGGMIYLLSPLSIVDWVIIGMIFSTMNGMFYGLTYAFREQIRHTIEAYQ